jgi:hypothetical protein
MQLTPPPPISSPTATWPSRAVCLRTPLPPFLYPTIASPTPPVSVEIRVERKGGQVKPRPGRQEQLNSRSRGGRGKGESWANSREPSSHRLRGSRLHPDQSSSRHVSAPLSPPAVAGPPPSGDPTGPVWAGWFPRLLVRKALACLDGLLACFVLQNPLRPASCVRVSCAAERGGELRPVCFPKFCAGFLNPHAR